MRSTIIFFLIFFIARISVGQSDISDFPFTIDSDLELSYKIDVVDKDFFSENGTNIVWDLSNSESPLYKVLKISDSGKNKIKVIDGESIRVFKEGDNSFDLLSYFNLRKSSLNIDINFNKPLLFSYKDLILGSKFSSDTDFDLTVTRTQLPKELKDLIPEKVKNIKIIGEIDRDFHCDADGKFIFELYDVPVLRIRVTENLKIRLYDMYSGSEIPFLSNSALSCIMPNVGVSQYYLFFNNNTKFYFAQAHSYGKDQLTYIEYQTDDLKNNDINIENEKKDFIIYPNPSYGTLKSYFLNISPGKYSMEIYNVIGKKIWKNTIDVNNKILNFDFSFLRKGTYLISLKDKFGNIISTKKLIIINV
ncbi:MAG: T9SS type A sorting domain-containing protein [Saprospiraceae bacterium]